MAKLIILILLSLIFVVFECKVEERTSVPKICATIRGCNCMRTKDNFWINVTCIRSSQDERDNILNISSDDLPKDLIHFDIKDWKEVNFLAKSFSTKSALRKINAFNVKTLRVRQNAFQNSAARNPLLNVENCTAVIFEKSAWSGAQDVQSIAVTNCHHVIVEEKPFAWLLDFQASNVARLDFHEDAFIRTRGRSLNETLATSIVIQNCRISEIPRHAFMLSAAKIHIDNTEINSIKKSAFSGNTVNEFILTNCTLRKIEEGAFSNKTMIIRLIIDHVKVYEIENEAVLSAVSNLTIQHSNFYSLAREAFNIPVVNVILHNNLFKQLQSKSFTFRQWDDLSIIGNTFANVASKTFWIMYESQRGGEFEYINNTIIHTDNTGGSLNFGNNHAQLLSVNISDNKFRNYSCQCQQKTWLKSLLSPGVGEKEGYNNNFVNNLVDIFYDTSFCVVTDVIARCFGDKTMGYMKMTLFWQKVCLSNPSIQCKSVGDSNEDIVFPVPIDPTESIASSRQHTYLILIMALVVIFSSIVLISCYCRKSNNNNSISYGINNIIRYLACHTAINNNNNNNNIDERMIDSGAIMTNSIDHIDIHGVGGFKRKKRRRRRPRRRDMGITANEDLALTDFTIGSSSESEAGTDRTCSTFDSSNAAYEDRGTQTVPEPDDLTEELLQLLKERLNDPEYYSEAKDMIEHLYDLIKVEEDANENTDAEETQEILPSTSQLYNNNHHNNDDDADESDDEHDSTYAEIGPANAAANRTTLCEYTEPQDRTHHVYTELPSTSANKTVAFLKSFLPNSNKKKNVDLEARGGGSATLTEYMEPSDARVHLYTELNSNFAQRPLPEKPK